MVEDENGLNRVVFCDIHHPTIHTSCTQSQFISRINLRIKK